MSNTFDPCRALVERLESAGHGLRVTEGGRLQVTHASELSDADRAAIRAARDDLVLWLSFDPEADRETKQSLRDAQTVARIIREHPKAGVFRARELAAQAGVTGDRWPMALYYLPQDLAVPRGRE